MTENLQSRLAPGAGSGIYRLEGRTAPKTLARLAEAAGWGFVRLDAGQVTDKAGFIAAASEALYFPAWAGHNWDAFEELVNDLSWLPPAPGYILLLDRLAEFARRQPEAMRTGLEILAAAVANRQAAHEPPLLVLVRAGGAAARHFPALTPKRRQPDRDTIAEQHDA